MPQHLSGSDLESESIENSYAVNSAVSERIKNLGESEEHLRQSSKIEAIGRLAGGIAHDFNNFLAVIMLHTEMLQIQLPPDSPLRYRVNEIKAVTDNAAAMVRQLLAFSRKQTLQPHPIVLNRVVNEFSKILRSLIGEQIELKISLDKDLGIAFVDQNQMMQVLMNLAVNARDALPHGGIIEIETSNIFLSSEADRHPAQPAGKYVQMKISDNGIGMDEETRARIFEPFFTTKEAGKGTGLGLATVYGIVKQSDGFIWVDSRIGEGASFKIHFPRIDQIPAAVKAEETVSIPHGSETILIVEDEEQVRRAAVEVLNVLGYQVFEAANGTQALQLAEIYKKPVDLLLTDVVMPKMNGKELAQKFLELHPEAAVLFMSGYTDDIIAHHGILDEEINFIGKPFSPSDLAVKVREALSKEN